MRSLADIPNDEIADIVLNFSIFYAENTFFRQSLIEDLDGETKNWMKRKFQETVPGEAAFGGAEVFKSRGLLKGYHPIARELVDSRKQAA